MEKELKLEDIQYFSDRYKKNPKNLEIENKIKEVGILKSSIDEEKKEEFRFEFNIETPEVKIYNQLGSHQCNTYAFLRVVKDILRNHSKLDVNSLDFSSNYINFFDKFEKANALYNQLIQLNSISLEEINQKVNQYIGSFGTFHFCKEIVDKYGLVLSSEMNEVGEYYNDSLTIELLRNKVKADLVSFISMSREEKISWKGEFMYGVFEFLSKVYGNPPLHFKFQEDMMTPLQFKEKYLGDFLEDYITVTPFSKEVLYSSYSFIPDIYLNPEEIVHLPIQKMKEAIVRQLRQGISVWFSSEESTTLDYDMNILDSNFYDVYGLLEIKKLSKRERMLLDMINYDHAMCITGALVVGNEVRQFKVDNSFGNHGKFHGQLIMTDSFLENCVITVVLNKKFVSKDK